MGGTVRTMVLLKSGDSRMVKMKPNMISKLAKSIGDDGEEIISLGSGEILTVVGFVVIGKKTGERVLILPKDTESSENTQRSGSRIEGSGGSHE